LDGNVATGNLQHGFFINYKTAHVVLTDNTAEGNGHAGFTGGLKSLFHHGSTAVGNGKVGIASGGEIVGCTARDNGGSGFGAFAKARLTDVEASGNASHGIVIAVGDPLVRKPTRVTVEGGRFHDNGGHGVLILGADGNRLTGNTVENNGAHGIALVTIRSDVTAPPSKDAGHNRVSGNTVNGHLAPSFDLFDEAAECGSNAWSDNMAASRSQACAE
jgi:parallel beta-helix repeat protein